MAAEEQKQAGPTKLVIRNIGLILSGALEQPILDGDAVVAVDGRISAIGRLKDLDTDGATTVVDAKGAVLTPGLIDSHVHPGVRRLDAAPEPARTGSIQLAARRGHHDDLRRRGAPAGPARATSSA